MLMHLCLQVCVYLLPHLPPLILVPPPPFHTHTQNHSFTVSVSPGLVQSLQASNNQPAGQGPPGRPEVVNTKEEAAEINAAYQKGIKDAQDQLRHHLVTQKEAFTHDTLTKEAKITSYLHEQIDEFRAKKFAPPQRPVACEEEAEKLVACYREKKKVGGQDSGALLGCVGLVDVYENCARRAIQGLDVTKKSSQ